MTRRKIATLILILLIAVAIALFYAPMLYGIAHWGDPVAPNSQD
jgi:hypothetical protein